MDTETMIRNLKKVEDDHKGDKVFTGQLNIADMAHDVRLRLEELKPYEDTSLTQEQIRELKERDTAKAPKHAPTGYGMICPICGNLVQVWQKHCGWCGQKLREDSQ